MAMVLYVDFYINEYLTKFHKTWFLKSSIHICYEKSGILKISKIHDFRAKMQKCSIFTCKNTKKHFLILQLFIIINNYKNVII